MMLKLGERGRYPDLIPMWERACEKGSLAGCHAAGWAWALNAAELGVVTDVARGRTFLSKACAAGYMVSCGVGARLVAQTKDSASYATAQAELVRACDLKERESCQLLGQTELHGTFGAKNEAAAASHFWEACRFGLSAGCSGLAYLNAVGIGVPKDSDKARKLAEVTCKELHDEAACKAAQTSDFAPLAPEVP
jgi:TPR repeat protein